MAGKEGFPNQQIVVVVVRVVQTLRIPPVLVVAEANE